MSRTRPVRKGHVEHVLGTATLQVDQAGRNLELAFPLFAVSGPTPQNGDFLQGHVQLVGIDLGLKLQHHQPRPVGGRRILESRDQVGSPVRYSG